jgi:hypothetical protein
MTDQPSQDSPEESPDPTHLHPDDGSDAAATNIPNDVPAEPETSYDTDGLVPQSHVA